MSWYCKRCGVTGLGGTGHIDCACGPGTVIAVGNQIGERVLGNQQLAAESVMAQASLYAGMNQAQSSQNGGPVQASTAHYEACVKAIYDHGVGQCVPATVHKALDDALTKTLELLQKVRAEQRDPYAIDRSKYENALFELEASNLAVHDLLAENGRLRRALEKYVPEKKTAGTRRQRP